MADFGGFNPKDFGDECGGCGHDDGKVYSAAAGHVPLDTYNNAMQKIRELEKRADNFQRLSLVYKQELTNLNKAHKRAKDTIRTLQWKVQNLFSFQKQITDRLEEAHTTISEKFSAKDTPPEQYDDSDVVD